MQRSDILKDLVFNSRYDVFLDNDRLKVKKLFAFSFINLLNAYTDVTTNLIKKELTEWITTVSKIQTRQTVKRNVVIHNPYHFMDDNMKLATYKEFILLYNISLIHTSDIEFKNNQPMLPQSAQISNGTDNVIDAVYEIDVLNKRQIEIPNIDVVVKATTRTSVDYRENDDTIKFMQYFQTPGDGNCFYHALYESILTTGDECLKFEIYDIKNWKDLKNIIINALEKYFKEGKDTYISALKFIEIEENNVLRDNYTSYEKYIEYMKGNGVWADTPIIMAAAELFSITLIIVSDKRMVVFGNGKSEIYLYNNNNTHFESIYKLSNGRGVYEFVYDHFQHTSRLTWLNSSSNYYLNTRETNIYEILKHKNNDDQDMSISTVADNLLLYYNKENTSRTVSYWGHFIKSYVNYAKENNIKLRIQSGETINSAYQFDTYPVTNTQNAGTIIFDTNEYYIQLLYEENTTKKFRNSNDVEEVLIEDDDDDGETIDNNIDDSLETNILLPESTDTLMTPMDEDNPLSKRLSKSVTNLGSSLAGDYDYSDELANVTPDNVNDMPVTTLDVSPTSDTPIIQMDVQYTDSNNPKDTDVPNCVGEECNRYRNFDKDTRGVPEDSIDGSNSFEKISNARDNIKQLLKNLDKLTNDLFDVIDKLRKQLNLKPVLDSYKTIKDNLTSEVNDNNSTNGTNGLVLYTSTMKSLKSSRNKYQSFIDNLYNTIVDTIEKISNRCNSFNSTARKLELSPQDGLSSSVILYTTIQKGAQVIKDINIRVKKLNTYLSYINLEVDHANNRTYGFVYNGGNLRKKSVNYGKEIDNYLKKLSGNQTDRLVIEILKKIASTVKVDATTVKINKIAQITPPPV
jgi:hypothetical protein